MLTLRCTRKLLKHLHAEPSASEVVATTKLGDWYGNLLFTTHLRLVICVSERSLLPVFVHVKHNASFASRFRAAARSVLESIGASPNSIDSELHEMCEVTFGTTSNRSVLGSLNELAFLARCSIEEQPVIDLATLAIDIAQTPCSRLKYDSPKTATLALLRNRDQDV